jgi:hypothetical protein
MTLKLANIFIKYLFYGNLMLTKLQAIGAAIVLMAALFMVQSVTGIVHAATTAVAGDCRTVCAVAGFFGAFAKAFRTIAFAGS